MLYILSITSVATNFCYDFTIVLPVNCAIKSGPRGRGKLTNNLFFHSFYIIPLLGGSLLRSFLVSGILLVQRHTTQNQFSAFGLRYEHYIRCYWQVCSTGSCPVPLLRTALTLFVPTSWDGCIRQNLDSKVVVRVKRWPTRKKSLLILLSWLIKQRFPLGPVPAAL